MIHFIIVVNHVHHDSSTGSKVNIVTSTSPTIHMTRATIVAWFFIPFSRNAMPIADINSINLPMPKLQSN